MKLVYNEIVLLVKLTGAWDIRILEHHCSKISLRLDTWHFYGFDIQRALENSKFNRMKYNKEGVLVQRKAMYSLFQNKIYKVKEIRSPHK